jgi:hypothetical protein
MAVIKQLEKTYTLHVKECRHSRILLGRNVEFLGEAWKYQGSGLALSEKTYIQNIIPKFEVFLERNWSPSRHPWVKDTILK